MAYVTSSSIYCSYHKIFSIALYKSILVYRKYQTEGILERLVVTDGRHNIQLILIRRMIASNYTD